MNTFAEHLEAQGRSQKTVQAYTADMQAFGVWFEWANSGNPFAGVFTPTDVREYKEYLARKKRSAATINRALASLRAYGAYLVATGQLTDNPARQARGVGQQRSAPKWLDKSEEAKLLRELERELLAARTTWAKAEAARNLAIVLLMLNTGLRVSELTALDWIDIDRRERSGFALVRNGKGDKARRVPLNLNARQALTAWSDAGMAPELDLAGPAVFVGRSGERLRTRAVQEMLKQTGLRAGVVAHPHRLRHTFAKKLINAGTPLDQVSMMMGHERLETTLRYTTPDEQDLARAVQRLED
ncbi:MAG: tyrosine-type recombinase/integrase [Anaerolineales bacterium]|nr:tyrosine-type recombinase/integrase [Anaerolineales bacterium]